MASKFKGKLLAEGKTKQIYQHAEDANLVIIESKDRITAGDGVKAHEMRDKSEFSTRTNAAIFEFLNAVGVPTSFVSRLEGSSKAFVARACDMVPIEWVTRRLATGSFLKRHPNVKEGYRFAPVKLETFFKDDANHDPYWSIESIKEASFEGLGRELTEADVERMCLLTKLIFQLLERAWQTLNHSLVDMKVEFGLDKKTGEIILSDVIDNDSWRLWPNGDKRLMLDKQVYRNLTQVDGDSMEKIRSNFALVAERTEKLFASLVPKPQAVDVEGAKNLVPPQVGIIMGSASDLAFVQTIQKALNKFGVSQVEAHFSSAHKSTEFTLTVVERLNQWPSCKCIIAVAGRSNGLGLVAAANSTIPVINCPPLADLATATVDVWSSLRLPSGLGCATVLGAECAAMAAAHIVANDNCFVWSKIKTIQTMAASSLIARGQVLISS